jgi:hypothetical protein
MKPYERTPPGSVDSADLAAERPILRKRSRNLSATPHIGYLA